MIPAPVAVGRNIKNVAAHNGLPLLVAYQS
jgi:hypothetical protein